MASTTPAKPARAVQQLTLSLKLPISLALPHTRCAARTVEQ